MILLENVINKQGRRNKSDEMIKCAQLKNISDGKLCELKTPAGSRERVRVVPSSSRRPLKDLNTHEKQEHLVVINKAIKSLHTMCVAQVDNSRSKLVVIQTQRFLTYAQNPEPASEKINTALKIHVCKT